MEQKMTNRVFALAWTKVFTLLTFVVKVQAPEQRLLLLLCGVLAIVFGFFTAYFNLR